VRAEPGDVSATARSDTDEDTVVRTLALLSVVSGSVVEDVVLKVLVNEPVALGPVSVSVTVAVPFSARSPTEQITVEPEIVQAPLPPVEVV
jgi:hypothetical protein